MATTLQGEILILDVFTLKVETRMRIEALKLINLNDQEEKSISRMDLHALNCASVDEKRNSILLGFESGNLGMIHLNPNKMNSRLSVNFKNLGIID